MKLTDLPILTGAVEQTQGVDWVVHHPHLESMLRRALQNGIQSISVCYLRFDEAGRIPSVGRPSRKSTPYLSCIVLVDLANNW